ncbi:MAG TPA: LacI family DNA-binding transcriptional regulator [Verrucomicrobiae bacterium]|nr:LacI family DNA-binding transcriptional regulator [Verrucomicrobiae bacterium]
MKTALPASSNVETKKHRSKDKRGLSASPIIQPVEVTMEAVAQKAGVARSTVSRALRNHPAIPLETRQRVREIADRLGYRPNPFVAALMSQLKSVKKPQFKSVIALISSFPIETGWKGNASVTRMVEGAFLQAQKLGYAIDTFCLAEPGMTEDRLSRILVARGIQGMIILPTPKSGAHLRFRWEKFSSVALGYSLAQPSLHRVCNHLAHTITKTLDMVLRLGYRRIGLAMRSDTDERVDHSWRSGYLLYRDMYPQLDFVPMLLTFNWKENSFRDWFQETKPEVVVSDDLRVQEWLKNLGAHIPKDVGLVHLDCSRNRSTCSGIDQHHEMLGAAAVDLVVGQLHRNETGVPFYPKNVMIEGTWVDGMTLRRKQASRKVTV